MRVLVVERSQVFREALHDVLNAEVDIEVVAVAADAASAFSALARLTPDVVVLGVDREGSAGITEVRELRHRIPSAGLVTFTAGDLNHQDDELGQLGVTELLEKGVANVEIVAAVRRAAAAA